MLSHAPPHPHHHRKLQLFVLTVVVGAILLFFLFSESSGFSSLTGSSISGETSSDDDSSSGLESAKKLITKTSSGKSSSSSYIQNSGDIAFQLDFNRVPDVSEKTRFKTMELGFKDLSSKIQVNKEELEVKELKDVKMKVTGFSGQVVFDETSVSLSGEAEKMLVNGIEISTKGALNIYFKDLTYNEMKITETKLGLMKFDSGSGKLSVGKKVNYDLSSDAINVNSFVGDLNVGGNNQSLIKMNGYVSGLDVDGDFDVKVN